MRPRGEVRAVLAGAAQQLLPGFPMGLTWRDLAEHTQVGFDVARQTVRNMERAGELCVVGQRPVDGAMRPMNLYMPAQPAVVNNEKTAALCDLLQLWARSAP